jgi:DNA (cytosine-5)-methyltransferase 1
VNELALFAGAGGGILGGLLLGWRTRCAVEIDPYARAVLLARQRDGLLEPFPIWDDVRTFDGRPWRGSIDIVTGGFPCQDVSSAGPRVGIAGARSGLWGEFARIIGEVRPRYAFVENSADLVSRGLDVVLGDLAALGFDARWGVLGARDAGAPHTRDRVWVLAHPGGEYGRQGMADPEGLALAAIESSAARARARRDGEPWHDPSPPALRVADGMAHRVDRIRAIGNGQVPRVVALAFETLAGAL